LIDKGKQEKAGVENQLRISQALVAEKEAENNTNMIQIQQHTETIFQKEMEKTQLLELMVQQDKKIRDEMAAKYSHEKIESEELLYTFQVIYILGEPNST
jgi:hypothetical protein